MTVYDLITNTLTVLNAIGVGESIAPEDSTLTLNATNMYIDSLNAAVKKSLAATYDPSLYLFVPVQELANLTDPLLLPNGWARALMYNVAIDVAPAFGRTVSAELASRATEAKAAIVTGAPANVA